LSDHDLNLDLNLDPELRFGDAFGNPLLVDLHLTFGELIVIKLALEDVDVDVNAKVAEAKFGKGLLYTLDHAGALARSMLAIKRGMGIVDDEVDGLNETLTDLNRMREDARVR
jgi:hypothetical protein